MPTLLSSMLLCTLFAWLLFGIVTAKSYRWVQPTLLNIDPDQASKLILGWLSLPPLGALITTAVMYSPDLTQWLVAGHCHNGSCQQHGPQSALAIWPTAILASWICLSIGRCLLRQWLSLRHLSAELSRAGRNAGAYVQLDDPQPAAFTLGWFNPKIFITTGMQSACSDQDIDCILAHERAHRDRLDNLRLLTAWLFTAPLPRSWSTAVLDDLRLSCEKASDLNAAQVSSRESVAAALIRIARLQRPASPAGSLAFAGTQTERRIRALLEEPVAALPNEYVFASVSTALLVILVIINPLHRAIEFLAQVGVLGS